MFSPGTPFADRYRIDAEVGRGTFGAVFRAFDFAESRVVALKVLNPEANSDEKLKHRLRREAKLTSELKGHRCVQVYDVAEDAEGRAYIVMELLEGRELRAAIAEEKTFPPPRAAEITRQMLEAVGEAHAVGVVHRDLKPNNIFLCKTVDGSDSVKVLDFGIAKVTGTADGSGLSESARLTTHGSVLGTPVYMSPEQTLGHVPTPASDFYSIGVMLYEMLTGKPPFDDPNPVRVMILHGTETVPPLPEPIASLPVGAAVMRALEKDASRRFQTADEFAEALTKPMPPAKAAPANGKRPADDSPKKVESAAKPPAKEPPKVAKPDKFASVMTGVYDSVDSTATKSQDAPATPTEKRNKPGLLIGATIVVAALIVAVVVWLSR